MINVNLNIITRTIPATPRSKNYPQGYVVKKQYTTNVEVISQSRSASQEVDLLQFIRDNRDAIMNALMIDNNT